MGNKNNKQKILNNEVNEEKLDRKKLDKVSGGNKFTAGNFEKRTEDIWIKETGIPIK